MQSTRIDAVNESVKKPQKVAEDNAELLQNLLVGIENMGGNFKKLREDMGLWQSPEYQAAEREYKQMNQEVMEEVTLSAPAISEPNPTSVAPHVSVPQFSAPLSVNIPQSGRNAVDMEFRETWERVQALRKPYPSAPNVTSVGGSAGLNLSSPGQAAQAKIRQFFTMGHPLHWAYHHQM